MFPWLYLSVSVFPSISCASADAILLFNSFSCVAHCHRRGPSPTATHRQVLIGSNTVSNVPLVLLMAPSIAALPSAAEVRCAWLLLSFVATVAGNLTLVGRCVRG